MPEKQKDKKHQLKKWLIMASLVFDIVVVVPIVLYFIMVPRNEIKSLATGYVKIKLVDKIPSYSFVKKRPANWTSFKEINYTAAHAIVVSEDWFYYQHNGYDLSQIKDALTEKIQDGGRLRGASTISQQVVKNLFLSNERSYIRKFKELVYAITLEQNVSKEKILEIYLNIIEYGDGIYGIKSAARHYFKKNPKELTAREGAFLAMLLPNPKRHAESFRNRELTEFARKTVDSILEKMKRAKYIQERQLEKFKKERFSWEKRAVTQKKSKKLKPGFKKSDGSDFEASYKIDRDVVVDDNPEFDEDALIEDTSGLQEEFSVE